MTAISQAMIIITPNQMGLKPRAVMTGRRIGVAIRIIDTMSRNIPMISRNRRIRLSMTHAG